MALIRWEPSRELQTLQQEMNRLFGTFSDSPTGNGGALAARQWIPAMDLAEQDDHYLLHADLPGVAEEDVKVELEGDVLTISGERRSERKESREGYQRFERAVGRFSRALTLPEGVDPDKIEARIEKGVLEVRIPKPEQRKPRRVAISVGDQPETIEGSSGEPSGGTSE
jgi:HSP20 family protein